MKIKHNVNHRISEHQLLFVIFHKYVQKTRIQIGIISLDN